MCCFWSAGNADPKTVRRPRIGSYNYDRNDGGPRIRQFGSRVTFRNQCAHVDDFHSVADVRDRGAETQISFRFMRWQFDWCERDKRAGSWVGRILNANPRYEKWKWLHVKWQENFCYECSSR